MDSIYEPGSDFDKVRTEDYIYDSEPRRKGGGVWNEGYRSKKAVPWKWRSGCHC